MQSIIKKQKDNTAKLAALRKQMNSVTTAGLHKDSDGFFQLTVDATTGEGGAIIRFLPAGASDDMPFVRIYNHAFPENGVWFIAGSQGCNRLDLGGTTGIIPRSSTSWRVSLLS